MQGKSWDSSSSNIATLTNFLADSAQQKPAPFRGIDPRKRSQDINTQI